MRTRYSRCGLASGALLTLPLVRVWPRTTFLRHWGTYFTGKHELRAPGYRLGPCARPKLRGFVLPSLQLKPVPRIDQVGYDTVLFFKGFLRIWVPLDWFCGYGHQIFLFLRIWYLSPYLIADMGTPTYSIADMGPPLADMAYFGTPQLRICA